MNERRKLQKGVVPVSIFKTQEVNCGRVENGTKRLGSRSVVGDGREAEEVCCGVDFCGKVVDRTCDWKSISPV